MKYRIPEHIIIEQTDTETVKDIIYHELTEAEFLIHYLQDPSISYWKIDGTTKYYYKNNNLIAKVENGLVIK